MEQLTNNFNLSEFFVSAKHPQLATRAKWLRISEVDRFLFLLCHLILQPVRDFVNVPVHITSGYRTKTLNERVGGSAYSLHMSGMAADIYTADRMLLHFIFDFIRDALAGRFCELILYVYPDGTPRNIHVALPCLGRKFKQKKKIIKEESK